MPWDWINSYFDCCDRVLFGRGPFYVDRRFHRIRLCLQSRAASDYRLLHQSGVHGALPGKSTPLLVAATMFIPLSVHLHRLAPASRAILLMLIAAVAYAFAVDT